MNKPILITLAMTVANVLSSQEFISDEEFQERVKYDFMEMPGDDKACTKPTTFPNFRNHICYCKYYQSGSACEFYVLQKSLDKYAPDRCYMPGPDMACIEIWLMPQCLAFHDDVSRQEWQACLDKPELYGGEGYDYGDAIRKLMEGAKDDTGALYDGKDAANSSAYYDDYNYSTFAINSFKVSGVLLGMASCVTSI